MHQMNSQYHWTWIGYRNVKVSTATHNPIKPIILENYTL